MKNKIKAEIVADSVNRFGDRITSFLLTYPRMIHSEVMTHRIFSRNSASSRAIPFNKMITAITNNPFVPIKWMKEHSGMQGTEYFTESDLNFPHLPSRWLNARDNAIQSAKALSSDGVTKQMCNRLVEPFAYHKVLVTATDFENFFSLRAENQAEIHIQDIAYKMLEVYNKSIPKLLKKGSWHIPYGDEIDEEKLKSIHSVFHTEEELNLFRVKIAVARCARTSYTTLDTEFKHDYEADIKLCDRLMNNGHMSPAEHVAKTMSDYEYENYTITYLNEDDEKVTEYGWCGNFKGFIQYRKTIKDENKKDARVIKK